MNEAMEKNFWDWFRHHESAFHTMLSKPSNEVDWLMADLMTQIKAYHRYLGAYVLCDKSGEGKSQLVITAEGRPQYFEIVDTLIAQAPRLRNWEILRLDPFLPISLHIESHLQAIGIDVNDLYFLLPDEPEDQLINLHVCATLPGPPTRSMQKLIRLMVMNLLGERMFGHEIGGVVLHNEQDLTEPELEELFPLDMLPEYFGGPYEPVWVIDQEGKLVEQIQRKGE